MPRNLPSDLSEFQPPRTLVWPRLIISTTAALFIALSIDVAAVGTMVGLAAGVPISHVHQESDARPSH